MTAAQGCVGHSTGGVSGVSRGAAVCTAADKRKAATGRAERMHLEKDEGR